MKRLSRNIEIIIAVSLCVYLPIVFGLINLKDNNLPFVGSDAVEYMKLSESILNGGFYTQDGVNHEVFRTPGYPLLLAISKGVFQTYWSIIFIQLLCTLGISILIFKICQKILSNNLSVFAAILFLIEPSVIVYTITAASDIPFTFLFILSIYLMFFRNVSYGNSILSGLLLGLATLIRPISLYFIPIALISYFVFNFKKEKYSKLILNLLILIVFSSLILLPWFVRNYRLFHKVTLSSLPSYNLFHYNLPEYYSYTKNIHPEEARDILKQDLNFKVLNDDELRRGEYMDILGDISSTHIKGNFVGYTRFHLLKTIPFFISSSIKNAFVMKDAILGVTESNIKYHNISSEILKGNIKELFRILKSEWLFFIERIIWGILLILALCSVFIKENRKISVLFITIIMYFAILTGPVSYVRYRLPIQPFLIVLTVVTLKQIYRKLTYHV